MSLQKARKIKELKDVMEERRSNDALGIPRKFSLAVAT
jgi:hypothetical protein